MLNPKEASEQIQSILKAEGFQLLELPDGKECDALYCKPRPGGASIYATVPVNPKIITKIYLDKLIKTSGIPKTKFQDILLPLTLSDRIQPVFRVRLGSLI